MQTVKMKNFRKVVFFKYVKKVEIDQLYLIVNVNFKFNFM